MRGWWLLGFAGASACAGCSPPPSAPDSGAPIPDPSGAAVSARPAASHTASNAEPPTVLVDGRPLRVERVETRSTLTNCCEGEQIHLSTVDQQGKAVELTVSLLRMDPDRRPAGPIDLAHPPDRFMVTVTCRPYGSCRCGDHGSINSHNSELSGTLNWTADPQAPRLQASLRLSSRPRDASGPASVEIVTKPLLIHTACVIGMDQTCNDSPVISSLRGRCREDGTCECLHGGTKNERSGKCR